ncbi:MAG: tRNA preQ1(34) S-adenosylmethionine ribosyltransferase-isomerase QueA [Candidatus Eisenbacteria sp.]|nr:tRNA preQ1(34) S-adenosylmethionine ribosyltransferase-isomerase QueA [Candidatus Eisenbacteria bacterium]
MNTSESLRETLARFSYSLPPSAIAQYPVTPRDASRLLVLRRTSGEMKHCHFRDLPALLAPGDLLVLNDTRVIPARLFGRKVPGGGKVEVLLVRDLGKGYWEAMLRTSRRLRPGLRIDLGEGYRLEWVASLGGPFQKVAIHGPDALDAFLARAGHVPLPPYIRRSDTQLDRESYQTVFARHPGAVAAPTAGLHFTPALLDALQARGIRTAWVTLHVGPGTFRPLRVEDLEREELHEEFCCLPEATAAVITETMATGGRIVAVGTTSTRVLEAFSRPSGEVRPGEDTTRIFIRPPYQPRVVDALITNFHLPRSSLLMLVAAFAGRERVLAAYGEALDHGYRFYSYGDAMLIL